MQREEIPGTSPYGAVQPEKLEVEMYVWDWELQNHGLESANLYSGSHSMGCLCVCVCVVCV